MHINIARPLGAHPQSLLRCTFQMPASTYPTLFQLTD